jgi:hypothetical protein
MKPPAPRPSHAHAHVSAPRSDVCEQRTTKQRVEESHRSVGNNIGEYYTYTRIPPTSREHSSVCVCVCVCIDVISFSRQYSA